MIVIRHGESEFNVVYGVTRTDPEIRDPKLTARGRDQGLVAGEALAAPITVEPLVRERCAWTCDIGIPTPRLAGAWPGVAFPAMAERWWPTDEEPDHGETLVVSHWWFIRALTGAALVNAAMVRVRLAPAVDVVSHPHP